MRKASAVLLLLAFALGACSGSTNAQVKAAAKTTPTPVPIELPSVLLGMKVSSENVSKQLAKVGNSYLDSMSLFGFRDNKLLRGTLQVGHFNALAHPEDRGFRQTMIGQFGSSVPTELRVGDKSAYLSAGQLQYQVLWFTGKWMYVLTVRRDFPFTRTLLRRLIDISQTNR